MSSSSNGVIRLGRKGMRKFQLGDDDPIVEFDVVHVWNQWLEIDRSYRTGDSGAVPPDKYPELNAALNKFACEMLQVKEMSDADALHFQSQLNKEVDALLDFFGSRSEEKPSSPQSTRLTFSE